MPANRNEPRVFFPWEKRRGLRSLFGRGRVRQGLVVVAAAAGFFFLHARERHEADVRATRAEITTAGNAVTAWRADHDRACPGSVAELVSGGYVRRAPRDAWGRVLRVTCPGRRDHLGFDVSSDGPDGDPWGADRVE
ncbi:MAG TPA: type II secretion system protein GspG [Polyangiaceae bacterium]|nr:type II secretion system protein GspG [Polyangiaceae bacterium]